MEVSNLGTMGRIRKYYRCKQYYKNPIKIRLKMTKIRVLPAEGELLQRTEKLWGCLECVSVDAGLDEATHLYLRATLFHCAPLAKVVFIPFFPALKNRIVLKSGASERFSDVFYASVGVCSDQSPLLINCCLSHCFFPRDSCHSLARPVFDWFPPNNSLQGNGKFWKDWTKPSFNTVSSSAAMAARHSFFL